MNLVAAAALFGWLLYSWPIGLALGLMCGTISLFYAGVAAGPAQARVLKVFSILVIALTLVMIGAINQTGGDHEDAPRSCNRVEC